MALNRGTHPPPRFDRIARPYRWAEYLALGPLLKRTREEFLRELGGCRRALLLGDGDGRFTAALLRRNPSLRAYAVDGSAAMLALLRARCVRDGNDGRLSIEQTSVLHAKPTPETDLIVSHFLLDCLSQEEIVGLARNLAGEVQPHCLWLVSDFGYPRPWPARVLAALYLRLLYAAFRVLTGLQTQRLPDPQAALSAAGFTCLCRRERLGGFLYAEVWRLGGSGRGAAGEQAVHQALTQLGPGAAHQPLSDR